MTEQLQTDPAADGLFRQVVTIYSSNDEDITGRLEEWMAQLPDDVFPMLMSGALHTYALILELADLKGREPSEVWAERVMRWSLCDNGGCGHPDCG